MNEWIEPGATSAAIAATLGSAGIALLCWRRRWLSETTLIAPWIWCVVSIGAVAFGEVLIGFTSAGETLPWHEPLRFVAAVTIFCPTMALLGAKRPQDKAWHLIVVSLWAVLVLPAAEQMLLQPNQPMEIQDARSWFLVALIVLSLLNSVLTRFWPTAILYTTTEIMLLAEHLPFSTASLGTAGVLTGLMLSVLAILLIAIAKSRRQNQLRYVEDQLWLDFRDYFCVLWSVRVAERINAAAKMYEWNIALSWNGFHRTDTSDGQGEIPSEVASTLRQTMKNLMRRFVSDEWMERRLRESDDTRQA